MRQKSAKVETRRPRNRGKDNHFVRRTTRHTKSLKTTDTSDSKHTDLSAVHDMARQRFEIEDRIAQLKARSAVMRDRMLEIAATNGTVDEHGHQRIRLDDPIVVGDRTYHGFMRRQSVSQTFNEIAARELLEARGLTDRALRSTTTTWIDQDALWGLQQEGLLELDEVLALVEKRYSYSLWGI